MTSKTLSALAGAVLGLTMSAVALAQECGGMNEPELRLQGCSPEDVRKIFIEAMDVDTDTFASPVTLAYASTRTAALPRAARPAPIAAANPYETIMNTAAPALVTIKFTMKVSSQQGDQEYPMEVAGLMIAKDGLVLSSNVVLNPASVRPQQGVTAVPTDVKILIGDDTEGVTAHLIATDKELDLAWVKIDAPAAAGYKALDMTASAPAALGAELACVERMGKIIDRAPKMTIGRCAGFATKPRKLLLTDGLDVYPGTPVFGADAKVVGVISFQLPDGEMDDVDRQDLRRLGTVLLPAENVVSATKRVLEQEAERLKSGAAEPAKPAEPGK